MSEVTYTVTLPFNFLAESRTRGGLVIPRDGGYEGPLTEDQLEAIRADSTLTLVEPEVVVEKPKTKAELLADAEAEGLVLEVTASNTVAQIVEAIELARAAPEEPEVVS